MKAFRCAVIGCGNISRRHTEALTASARAELVAVCDIREDRAKAAGEKFGVPFYTDYRELLAREDIDSVHICTPHYLHAPIAIAALSAGKHVFTEKPMATTPEDCEAMIAAADAAGKYLGVCFQNRYKFINAKLRELVLSGIYGKPVGGKGIVTWYRDIPYYADSGWRGSFATEGGGVLINQSIHTLDLLLWTLGDPVDLRASCGIFSELLEGNIEVEDTATAHLRFEGGATALFFASNAWKNNSPIEFEIQCEKALLIAADDELIIRAPGKAEERIADTTPKTDDKSYWGNCHSIIIEDFYAAISDGRPFAVDGKEGKRALTVIDGIYKASGFGPRA
ncbi:MAG: Gfo/Idh/MocA family oxidoreductase [Clostridia bacterium]|nr:Gfo/Idh/MocA family oxidoreductase [Clostridia bacterium]